MNRGQALDESLHYAMAFELWNYFIASRTMAFILDVLTAVRLSEMSKTATVSSAYE